MTACRGREREGGGNGEEREVCVGGGGRGGGWRKGGRERPQMLEVQLIEFATPFSEDLMNN